MLFVFSGGLAYAGAPAPRAEKPKAALEKLETFKQQLKSEKQKATGFVKEKTRKLMDIMRGADGMYFLGLGLLLLIGGIIITFIGTGILNTIGSVLTAVGVLVLVYWLLILLGIVGWFSVIFSISISPVGKQTAGDFFGDFRVEI